jgi:hypothetical protein
MRSKFYPDMFRQMVAIYDPLKMVTICRNMSEWNLERINKNSLLPGAFFGHFTTILQDARSSY